MRRLLLASLVLAGWAAASLASAQTFKVVMHSDVKALDPVWSGAYITRNHGYMLAGRRGIRWGRSSPQRPPSTSRSMPGPSGSC
jgi:hypothetical protein